MEIDFNKLLRELCEENYKKIVEKNEIIKEKYKNRLEKELDYIEKNGYAYVFLTLWEVLIKNKKIVFLINASMAGSLVSYLLGLTESDPLREDIPLYFELLFTTDGDMKTCTIYVDENYENIIREGFIKSNYSYVLEGGWTDKDGIFYINPFEFTMISKELDLSIINPYIKNVDNKKYIDYKLLSKEKTVKNYSFYLSGNNVSCNILGRILEKKDIEFPDFKKILDNNIYYTHLTTRLDYSFRMDKVVSDTFKEYVNNICISHEEWAHVDDVIVSIEDLYEVVLSSGKSVEESLKYINGVKMDLNSVYMTIINELDISKEHRVKSDRIGYLWKRAGACEEAILEIKTDYYSKKYPQLFYKIYFENYATDLAKEYYSKRDFYGFENEVFNDRRLENDNRIRSINEDYYRDYIMWKNKIKTKRIIKDKSV